jgi:hypothetical protein
MSTIDARSTAAAAALQLDETRRSQSETWPRVIERAASSRKSHRERLAAASVRQHAHGPSPLRRAFDGFSGGEEVAALARARRRAHAAVG